MSTTVTLPELPGVILATLKNFEEGFVLVINKDDQKARFQGKTKRADFDIDYEDALRIQKALSKGAIKDWFDATHPGQLVFIDGDVRSASGPTPPAPKKQRRRPDRMAVAGAVTDEGPSCAFERVSITTAEAWLECNVSNRPMDERMVSRYVTLMKSSKFMLTGDAVQFDTEGRLVNGQHRLEAIRRSGIAQTMLVVRGLEPKVFKVLDYGKRRSPADALHVEGFVNSRNLAALCKLICAWIAGRLEGISKMSVEPHYIVDIAYRFDSNELPETVSGAIKYTHNLYPKFKQLLPLSFVSFVYWAYARLGAEEKEKITSFVEQLATGFGIEDRQTPAGQLRRILIEDAISAKKLPAFLKFGFTIQAARLHMAGEKAENLKWRGDFPQPGTAPVLFDNVSAE